MLLPFLGQAQIKVPLPPQIDWSGQSETLIHVKSDPWVTPAERSNFDSTASWHETIQYFTRLDNASDLLTYEQFGESTGGFEMHLAKLSKELQFHKGATSSKPVLLIQAGIHAGEIDGKDASMMIARDIAIGEKHNLLDAVNIVIVPIFNIEGHERISPYNRINQRGPKNMGWRTNGSNLNLNRDYAKAETQEMVNMIELINVYKPSLYLDIHVTDGADYQYDITYGFIGEHGYSPSISEWLSKIYRTQVNEGLEVMGHIPGPLLFAKNGETFEDGNLDYTFNPDFSHAYGDAIHLPTVLVENHSLKPFKQRVLGTYVLIENSIKALELGYSELKIAISKDALAKKDQIGVNWVFSEKAAGSNTNPWNADSKAAINKSKAQHLGVSHEIVKSSITGSNYTKWTGKKTQKEIDVYRNSIAQVQVQLPKYYVIPAFRNELINKILVHQIDFDYLESDTLINATSYHMSNPVFAKGPFEGRIKVTADCEVENLSQKVPKGSILIPTNQTKGVLAALLLEPQSPSSLFQWGFMNTIFNRTEYIESYVMEPYMAEMLKQNPEIREAYQSKMKDRSFSDNPRKIMEWFYTQSPFVDQTYLHYPILKIF